VLTWAVMIDVWTYIYIYIYTLKRKLQQTVDELFSQKDNRRLSGLGKQIMPEIFASDKKYISDVSFSSNG